jgi:hypothetical protein
MIILIKKTFITSQEKNHVNLIPNIHTSRPRIKSKNFLKKDYYFVVVVVVVVVVVIQ